MILEFYLYEINVYDGGKEIGFEENILSDNLSLSNNLPDTVQGELFSHFVWNNCIISDNYFRYKKFKSIEQCTGLKDKNGKLIYEGDILKFAINNPEEDYFYGGVRYSSENWKYELVSGNETFCLCQVLEQDMEVVGNIHENPELMEDK